MHDFSCLAYKNYVAITEEEAGKAEVKAKQKKWNTAEKAAKKLKDSDQPTNEPTKHWVTNSHAPQDEVYSDSEQSSNSKWDHWQEHVLHVFQFMLSRTSLICKKSRTVDLSVPANPEAAY